MASVQNTSHQSLIEMMRVIHQELLDRLQRGELDYVRDQQTLLRQLGVAQEIKAAPLVGGFLDTLGLLENEIGANPNAEQYWEQAYQVFETAGDLAGMARVRLHLGELFFRLDDLDQALENYEAARGLAEHARDKTIIMQAESNLGLLWLLANDLLQARVCFALVIAVTEYETWQHVQSLITARRGLAEVHLTEGYIKAAWQEAHEAERLAGGGQLRLLLAQTYLTMSHIAEQDSPRYAQAAQYRSQAYDLLHDYRPPVVLARALLQEARYQGGKGYSQDAANLAQQARDLLLQLKLATEAEQAERLLRQLR